MPLCAWTSFAVCHPSSSAAATSLCSTNVLYAMIATAASIATMTITTTSSTIVNADCGLRCRTVLAAGIFIMGNFLCLVFMCRDTRLPFIIRRKAPVCHYCNLFWTVYIFMFGPLLSCAASAPRKTAPPSYFPGGAVLFRFRCCAFVKKGALCAYLAELAPALTCFSCV